MRYLLFVFLLFLGGTTQLMAQDWAKLARYQEANAALATPAPGEKRVVFMGNSITEGWGKFCPDFFAGRPYLNRGISGQTTPQMLVRFRPDVLALQPGVVVILAGTNDIAGNTGPATQEEIVGNIVSMIELARANKVRVVLCAVLPAADFPWRKGLEPAAKIQALNTRLANYARTNHIPFVDYYAAMNDGQGGLLPAYTYDGVHPNEAGYRVMIPLVEAGIHQALRQKSKR